MVRGADVRGAVVSRFEELQHLAAHAGGTQPIPESLTICPQSDFRLGSHGTHLAQLFEQSAQVTLFDIFSPFLTFL
jgi:hypothetical protein